MAVRRGYVSARWETEGDGLVPLSEIEVMQPSSEKSSIERCDLSSAFRGGYFGHKHQESIPWGLTGF